MWSLVAIPSLHLFLEIEYRREDFFLFGDNWEGQIVGNVLVRLADKIFSSDLQVLHWSVCSNFRAAGLELNESKANTIIFNQKEFQRPRCFRMNRLAGVR